MRTILDSLATKWKSSFASRTFRWKLLLIVLLAIVETTYLRQFMFYNEQRPGVQMADVLLSFLPAVDVSIPIFLLLYLGMVTTIILLIGDPHRLINLILAYGILCILRGITLYLFPLEPPISYIALKDPFLDQIYNGRVLLKDLFFSGHTASIFICALAIPKAYKKYMYGISFLIAILLLFQHIHYTIDVIAAPFFAYLSFAIVLNFERKFGFYTSKQLTLRQD